VTLFASSGIPFLLLPFLFLATPRTRLFDQENIFFRLLINDKRLKLHDTIDRGKYTNKPRY